jgi:hypothetical protein
MGQRDSARAGRDRGEGLSQKALEPLHCPVKTKSCHSIWAVMGRVLPHRFTKCLFRSGDVAEVVGNLKRLTNRVTKRAPRLWLAASGGGSHHGAGGEKRAGLGALIAHKIDFRFAFPGLSGRDPVGAANRAANDPNKRGQAVAMQSKPNGELLKRQDNQGIAD